MMNTILKRTATAAALAMLAAPVAAQSYPNVNLRFAHIVPSTAITAQADGWYGEQVAARSGGAVQHEYFWAGAAGAAAEILDLTGQGAVDVASVTPSFYGAQLPLLAAFSSIPFSFNDPANAQTIANILFAEFPALQAEAARANLHINRFAVMNDYHMMCTRPVRRIEDMAGLRIRSQGEYIPLLIAAVGGTPVTVLPGEFYEALQRSSVDCIILPWDFLASNRLYEVARYASDINLGPIVAHLVAYNLDTWNGLAPEVQELLTATARDAGAYDLERVGASSAASLQRIMDGGVELIPFEDQARLEELVGDMVGVWAQRMVDRGLGAEAAAIAERWRQLR
jgi:TRAP-type transport system periplasmic protein